MSRKPVVVGVDHSPESLRAAAVAAKIASATSAELLPVHAVPPLPLATGLGGLEPTPVFSPELQEELNRASRAQVEQALHDVLPAPAVAKLVVATGPAPFVLAEVARERQAQLIVLGGRHHGALARGLGRSTAHYLVRTLDVPLLVVGGAAASLARVLAAIDLSEASLPTIKMAERLANLLGARLGVMHAVEPLRLIYLPVAPLDQAAFDQRSRQGFDRLMAPFKAVASEDRVVRTGLAAETIAEEAAAWHADVLVVGSHGKGWVDRMLVGSTTERLLNVLPTSLLVIPTGQARRQAAMLRSSRTRPRKRARQAAASKAGSR